MPEKDTLKPQVMAGIFSLVQRMEEVDGLFDKVGFTLVEEGLGGLIRACEKRPVSFSTMEEIVNEIEQTLQNEMEREVSSAEIGELVMERLKKVDEVSYVRFASVYRQFKDINTFMRELNKLLEDK